jgi:hypothetical protein
MKASTVIDHILDTNPNIGQIGRFCAIHTAGQQSYESKKSKLLKIVKIHNIYDGHVPRQHAG